jgi:predicted molibdopterin-dependent oxidoreductase YjgC
VVEITLDDKVVHIKEGETLVTAARKAGIWIPALCYIEGLSTYGACRLCLVEVERPDGRRRLVTSCNYPVRKDMEGSKVYVSSPAAEEARKGVMELLLARSPESEELKALAGRMGISGTPYPTVTESQRSCILCGLCMKVCEEAVGVSAIGFAGRGVNRSIATPFKLASDRCIVCGACAAVCPVGTIRVRIHGDTGEAEISPFKTRAKLLVCGDCGKRTVTVPAAKKTTDLVNMDWDEFRERARLCPDCRRKRAAASLAVVEDKRLDLGR